MVTFLEYLRYDINMLHIWLVIELAPDILPTNMFTKFDDYTMKTIEVIEQTNALDAACRTCSHNTSRMITPLTYNKACT